MLWKPFIFVHEFQEEIFFWEKHCLNGPNPLCCESIETNVDIKIVALKVLGIGKQKYEILLIPKMKIKPNKPCDAERLETTEKSGKCRFSI